MGLLKEPKQVLQSKRIATSKKILVDVFPVRETHKRDHILLQCNSDPVVTQSDSVVIPFASDLAQVWNFSQRLCPFYGTYYLS